MRDRIIVQSNNISIMSLIKLNGLKTLREIKITLKLCHKDLMNPLQMTIISPLIKFLRLKEWEVWFRDIEKNWRNKIIRVKVDIMIILVKRLHQNSNIRDLNLN